jgi:hypothetical protein
MTLILDSIRAKTQGLDFAAERQPGRGAMGEYYSEFGQKTLDSFVPRLIRLKRVQDEMQLQLGVDAQPPGEEAKAVAESNYEPFITAWNEAKEKGELEE